MTDPHPTVHDRPLQTLAWLAQRSQQRRAVLSDLADLASRRATTLATPDRRPEAALR